MKPYLILIYVLFLVFGAFAQEMKIGDNVFSVDTLQKKHEIEQGITYASYVLPDYPLRFYVLEIDLTNPYVHIETCLANDSSLTLEAPTNMVKRHNTLNHKVIAGTNGDFYFYKDPVEIGIPRSGQFQKNECTANPTGRASFVLGPDDKPYIDRVDFNGVLKTADKTARIHTVNMLRLEAEPEASANMLTLYTSTFGHVTSSLEGGTKVIIRPKEGDTFFFSANKDIACVVEKVFPNTGTSVIPKGWAVLHGRGTSSDFLKSLAFGDNLTIRLGTNLRSAPGFLIDFKEMIGGSDHIILRDGEKAEGDSLYNPRTGIGISKDKTKVFVVVADGRSDVSKGVTMVGFGQLFKALGAWDAVNMDGGGSSVMIVDNQVMNTPSDKNIRPVGTGLLITETPIPVADRIKHLLGRMTLEEKIAQMRHIHFASYDVEGHLDLNKLNSFAKGNSFGCIEAFPYSAEAYSKTIYEAQKYMKEKTRLGIPVLPVMEALHGTVQDGCTIFPQSIALGSSFNPGLFAKWLKVLPLMLRQLESNRCWPRILIWPGNYDGVESRKLTEKILIWFP